LNLGPPKQEHKDLLLGSDNQLLSNDSVNIGCCQVKAATVISKTTPKMLGHVLSVQFVLRLYNEQQLQLRDSSGNSSMEKSRRLLQDDCQPCNQSVEWNQLVSSLGMGTVQQWTGREHSLLEAAIRRLMKTKQTEKT
jgi:hypothetical protein